MARNKKNNKNTSSPSSKKQQKNVVDFQFNKGKSPRHIRFSSAEFESDLESIVEETELETGIESEPVQEESQTVTVKPLLRLAKEDVMGEINFWSTSVVCYILGANPPSSVITGFVKRVWQSYGVDKIAFMPNGIFLVRFKTKEQQKLVLNNGHLIFDNKPVIVREWEPELELVKHSVKRVPIWIKMYGLDVKFWGSECLKKISGTIGSFIKCDDATQNRNFLGYARTMVEVNVDQDFPTEIVFLDENDKSHTIRVMYDWLPLTCASCKVLAMHALDKCRKGETRPVVKKVWKPRVVAPVAPQKVQQVPVQKQITPIQSPTVQRPVQNHSSPKSVEIVTPVMVTKPVLDQSLPRRFITRMMRQETGEKNFTPGGLSFMAALSHSIQKTKDRFVEKGECSKFQVDNGWSICTNASLHNGGRMWLLWDPTKVIVDVLSMTDQTIHARVYDKIRSKGFWYTLVYGFNKAAERENLWKSIRRYHSSIVGPWIVCGDFNTILATHERIGGAKVTLADIKPLAQLTHDCQIYDLKATGSFFTWNNKHDCGVKVYSRIDRVLINGEWQTEFPDSVANFLPEGLFDHCPCLIQCEAQQFRKPAAFKYYNMWSLAKEFKSIVASCWSIEVQGTPMFRVVSKLKML
ncbi:uncharacterized protein LOC141630764 [Silene latifolia]|uniref:uncharacterized protein LOC141630764 n=1 Tax=Silene latifolia TaxID=37657 RepID=UPI003D786AF8